MRTMETDRILLRRWSETDAESLFKYASDPEVGPRAGWPPHDTVETSLQVIRDVFMNDYTWAIVLKPDGESFGGSDGAGAGDRARECATACEGDGAIAGGGAALCPGEAIGAIGYFPYGESNIPIPEGDVEIGYWIARPFWNKGICTEALRLILDYCKDELECESVWSDHFISNPASGRVMEKCGFVATGDTHICDNLYGGSREPVLIYKLTF